jgi:hypothetical protein
MTSQPVTVSGQRLQEARDGHLPLLDVTVPLERMPRNLAYQEPGRPSCCRTKIVVDSEYYGR